MISEAGKIPDGRVQAQGPCDAMGRLMLSIPAL